MASRILLYYISVGGGLSYIARCAIAALIQRRYGVDIGDNREAIFKIIPGRIIYRLRD